MAGGEVSIGGPRPSDVGQRDTVRSEVNIEKTNYEATVMGNNTVVKKKKPKKKGFGDSGAASGAGPSQNPNPSPSPSTGPGPGPSPNPNPAPGKVNNLFAPKEKEIPLDGSGGILKIKESDSQRSSNQTKRFAFLHDDE